MFLNIFSVDYLNFAVSWRNGSKKIRSLPFFEKIMIVLWLLGPFIYMIERSPADIWLSVLAIVFLARSIIKKDWRWMKKKWFRFAIALWLTGLFSAIISPDPYFTFTQGFVWIRFPLYAIAVQTWLARDRDIRIIMLMSMCIGMIAMCFILLSEIIIEPKPRLTWPYGDLVPGGYLAKVSLPLFCVLVAIAVNKVSRISGYFGLISLFSLVMLLLTGERTNSILRACSGMMAAFFWKPKYISLLFLVIVEILAVLILFLTKPDLGKRFTKTFYESLPMVNVNTGHFGTWRSGLQQGLETPIIGIGPSGTRKKCVDLPPNTPSWLPGKNLCANHPHNFYVQLFAETGVVGLFFGICMICSIIIECYKGRKNNFNCPMLGTAFVVPFGIFFPIQQFGSFFGQWNNLFIWFAIAFALSQIQDGKYNSS